MMCAYLTIVKGEAMKLQRIIRAVLTCAIVSVALMGSYAWAELTEKQAYALGGKADSGDKVALETLMTEAQKSNQYAQFSLGVLYDIGHGVSQDYGQAAQWYRKAAEQGVAGAQFNLGVLYDNGRGVLQDYGQAAQWYRKAAEQGFARAQHNLGVHYRDSQGVPQDYSQAVQWFRKAAEQGDASAQDNLGFLYRDGRGVSQDYGQAAQWFRKAAQQGNVQAQTNLGVLYAMGQGVPRNITVAYALFDLSAAQDASRRANGLKGRALAEKMMTKQQIEAGQALSREMGKPSDLLKALDAYLAVPAVK
jgi:TPR repeat protein